MGLALSAAAISLRWLLAHEHTQLTVRGPQALLDNSVLQSLQIGANGMDSRAACALTVAQQQRQHGHPALRVLFSFCLSQIIVCLVLFPSVSLTVHAVLLDACLCHNGRVAMYLWLCY